MVGKYCGVLFIVVITIVIGNSLAKPLEKLDVKFCFHQECPTGTTSCEKYSCITKDKQYLTSTIYCLDNLGNKLKEFKGQVENPFSSGTHYEGYSYSSVYEFSFNDLKTTEKPIATDTKEVNNEVTDLLKA